MSLYNWAKNTINNVYGVDYDGRTVRMPTDMEVYGNSRNTGGKGQLGPWTEGQIMEQIDANRADQRYEAQQAYDAKQRRAGLLKGIGALGAGLRAQGSWEGTTNPFGGSDAMIRGVDAFTQAMTKDDRTELQKQFEADIKKLMTYQGLTREQAITQLQSDERYARLLKLRGDTADVVAKEVGIDKDKYEMLPDSEKAIINEANIYIRQGIPKATAIQRAAKNQGKDLTRERASSLLDLYIKREDWINKGLTNKQLAQTIEQSGIKFGERWLDDMSDMVKSVYWAIKNKGGTDAQANLAVILQVRKENLQSDIDNLPPDVKKAYERAVLLKQGGDERAFEVIFTETAKNLGTILGLEDDISKLESKNKIQDLKFDGRERWLKNADDKYKQLYAQHLGRNPTNDDVVKATNAVLKQMAADGKSMEREQWSDDMKLAWQRAEAIVARQPDLLGDDPQTMNEIFQQELGKILDRNQQAQKTADTVAQAESITAQNVLDELNKTPAEKRAETYNAKVEELVLNIGGSVKNSDDVEKARKMIAAETFKKYNTNNIPDLTGEPKNIYETEVAQEMIKSGDSKKAHVAGMKKLSEYWFNKGEKDKAKAALDNAEAANVELDTENQKSLGQSDYQNSYDGYQKLYSTLGYDTSDETIKKRANASKAQYAYLRENPTVMNKFNDHITKVDEEIGSYSNSARIFEDTDKALLSGNVETGMFQSSVFLPMKKIANLFGADFNVSGEEIVYKNAMKAVTSIIKAVFGGNISDGERNALLDTMGTIDDEFTTVWVTNKFNEITTLAGKEIKELERQAKVASGRQTVLPEVKRRIREKIWAKYQPKMQAIREAVAKDGGEQFKSKIKKVYKAKKIIDDPNTDDVTRSQYINALDKSDIKNYQTIIN